MSLICISSTRSIFINLDLSIGRRCAARSESQPGPKVTPNGFTLKTNPTLECPLSDQLISIDSVSAVFSLLSLVRRIQTTFFLLCNRIFTLLWQFFFLFIFPFLSLSVILEDEKCLSKKILILHSLYIVL